MNIEQVEQSIDVGIAIANEIVPDVLPDDLAEGGTDEPDENEREVYLPTEEQIRAECLIIQSGWSNHERLVRAGLDPLRYKRWYVPGSERFRIKRQSNRRPADALGEPPATGSTREAFTASPAIS